MWQKISEQNNELIFFKTKVQAKFMLTFYYSILLVSPNKILKNEWDAWFVNMARSFQYPLKSNKIYF